MMRNFTSALVVGGLTACIGTGVQARPAQCLLEVNGNTFIDGACDFQPLGDGTGSFTITSPKGIFFAYLYVEGSARATGHWNEEAGASHAHSPLGPLRRDGACWINQNVKLCAW